VTAVIAEVFTVNRGGFDEEMLRVSLQMIDQWI